MVRQVNSDTVIFKYLGSGKTYTMMGDSGVVNKTGKRIPGLYVLAIEDLFDGMS